MPDKTSKARAGDAVLTREQAETYRQSAAERLAQAGIVLTQAEMLDLEVADFALDDFEHEGLLLYTYVNTERYCAKELVMLPRQTCPEHRHPPVTGNPGKLETFRCRQGQVWLYLEGFPTEPLQGQLPAGSEAHYTVFHEVPLTPGEQFTIPPDTLHWFQAGDEGAIISEFSSTSRDEFDVFTDPRIRRLLDPKGA